MKPIRVSILVPAYNEEKNIGKLLTKLLHQKIVYPFRLNKIVVVVSGCTDRTEQIVKSFLKTKKIALISQKERLGKASAINLFLKRDNSDIVVMISADVLPSDKYTVNNLLQPFLNKHIGMVSGRPIPINDSNSLTNKISGLVWHLHHRLSSSYPPKVGEIVAFRKTVKQIPGDSLADEEIISGLIQRKGYSVRYAKDAVVYNKSPETISDLIIQRKRIFIGHLLIKKYLGYKVPSLSTRRLLKIVIKEITLHPEKIFTVIPLTILEIYVRILGFLDYLTGRYETVWKVSKTTKNLT